MLDRQNHRTDQHLPEGCLLLRWINQLYFSYKFCAGSRVRVVPCGHTFTSINDSECKHWNKSSGGDRSLHIEGKAKVQCFCGIMQHHMTYVQYRNQTVCSSPELYPFKASCHLQHSTSFNAELGILLLY